MVKNNDKPIDENEDQLDSIFEDAKRGKLSKALKRAKRRSIIRTVIISIFVIGAVFIFGSVLNRELTYKMEGPIQVAVDRFNDISAPNNFIGKTTRYHDFLGGRNEYTTYKLIEGKVIYTGTDEYQYGLLQPNSSNPIGSGSPILIADSFDEEDIKTVRYNELGQREMVFFYPFVQYNQYRNDIQLLNNINTDKYIEIALSFDKSYSIADVNKMIPKDVTLAWYWVDDLSGNEKKSLHATTTEQIDEDGKSIFVEQYNKVLSENRAYGIKAFNSNGERLTNPEESFINSLTYGYREREELKGESYKISAYKHEFKRVYENIAGSDGELTEEDIKVQGVVVTGDAATLKSLENKSFIKASSFGVIVDKH